MTYIAWMIPPRPAANLITQLVITDDRQNGRAVAGRAVTYGTGNVEVWDASLAKAGYSRTSDWRRADDDWCFTCTVLPAMKR